MDEAGTYRNVTQNRQQDIDEEVGIASTLEKDTKRRQDDSEDDLDDVTIHRLAMRNKGPKTTSRTVAYLAVKGMMTALELRFVCLYGCFVGLEVSIECDMCA